MYLSHYLLSAGICISRKLESDWIRGPQVRLQQGGVLGSGVLTGAPPPGPTGRCSGSVVDPELGSLSTRLRLYCVWCKAEAALSTLF